MINSEEYSTAVKPTWCPGCGNFGIWMALKNALSRLDIPSYEAVVVYGVGCHGNMRDWLRVYGVQGLHGRAIPVAQGIKLINDKLHVIVVSGDGDCLGEGGNHFLHAAKRNSDITVIIHDNQVYGLTTGQASPTAQAGFKTKSTPDGVIDTPINPLSIALVSGASLVARGFAGDIPQLTETLSRAISHQGFSVVDVLQPCVTFDKVHTCQWYRERIYKLEKISVDKQSALQAACEWGDKIPVGVLYENSQVVSPAPVELKTGNWQNLLAFFE